MKRSGAQVSHGFISAVCLCFCRGLCGCFFIFFSCSLFLCHSVIPIILQLQPQALREKTSVTCLLQPLTHLSHELIRKPQIHKGGPLRINPAQSATAFLTVAITVDLFLHVLVLWFKILDWGKTNANEFTWSHVLERGGHEKVGFGLVGVQSERRKRSKVIKCAWLQFIFEHSDMCWYWHIVWKNISSGENGCWGGISRCEGTFLVEHHMIIVFWCLWLFSSSLPPPPLFLIAFLKKGKSR